MIKPYEQLSISFIVQLLCGLAHFELPCSKGSSLPGPLPLPVSLFSKSHVDRISGDHEGLAVTPTYSYSQGKVLLLKTTPGAQSSQTAPSVPGVCDWWRGCQGRAESRPSLSAIWVWGLCSPGGRAGRALSLLPPQITHGQFDERYVLSSRVRTGRSIRGLSLPPACTRAERREVENVVVTALSGLRGDLSGKYYSLTNMTEREQQQLIDVSPAPAPAAPAPTLLELNLHLPRGHTLPCGAQQDNHAINLRLMACQCC